MKTLFILTLLAVSFSCGLASCGRDDDPATNKITMKAQAENTSNKMKLTIGDKVFTITLTSNPSATALKALLPLTITMSELNNNEKVYHLNATLPVNSSRGPSIQVGDFMLYGNNALVLFYENFNTPYTYTRLGKVDDISGYKTALGAGDVTVTFELH